MGRKARYFQGSRALAGRQNPEILLGADFFEHVRFSFCNKRALGKRRKGGIIWLKK